MTTLVLVLKEIESENKTKCDTFYSNSKVEIITNESDTDNCGYSYIKHIKLLQRLYKIINKFRPYKKRIDQYSK